ncbi:ABC transporter permease [Clostridium sp. KNHs214]|uniref:ABC transporter permease n=1 Tax=Clostridium sp. KNHs214 TaxID=1540257 RepID=UPI0005585FBD|nr:ABC transporter permease [Clostridium sp. KNHs214]
MLRYILKRIGYMLVTLWIIITITFMLIHAVPGDPLASMARNLPEQIRKNFYAKYGLDQPPIVQYGSFMKRLVLKGDFGESLTYPGRSVTETIKKYAPTSARLGGQALLIGIVIGITLGIIAAFHRNTWVDYLVMFIAIIGVALPVFVLAALLQYAFTVKWQLLPTTGWGSFKHTILPTIGMSFGTIATYARYMRTSVLDVVGQDYILTAKAKGVSRVALVWKHVLRNALLPAITLLGPQIAGIFGGAFITESIFAIPGIGFNFVESINNRDYTMIMGQTIFMATLFIVALLVVDILYSVVDPRIRVDGESR